LSPKTSKVFIFIGLSAEFPVPALFAKNAKRMGPLVRWNWRLFRIAKSQMRLPTPHIGCTSIMPGLQKLSAKLKKNFALKRKGLLDLL
jgi:hypothetical protein